MHLGAIGTIGCGRGVELKEIGHTFFELSALSTFNGTTPQFFITIGSTHSTNCGNIPRKASRLNCLRVEIVDRRHLPKLGSDICLNTQPRLLKTLNYFGVGSYLGVTFQ